MRIQGAVLRRAGVEGPYAQSKPLRIEDLDLDPPGPLELLVRIEAAGICHSDLSVVDGSRPRPVPMLLGHEATGKVIRAGSAVSDVRAGQRVVATFLPRCGQCDACGTDGRLPCEAGSHANGTGSLLSGGQRLHSGDADVLHHLGVSGFATHAVLDRRSVVPIDDDIPSDVAAILGCAVLTGGGALLNAGRPEPGHTVAIVGLGGVGMAAVLVAASLANVRVVAIDVLSEKTRAAREIGAHTALTPQDAVADGIKADIVIECAGSARAFETAIAVTAPGGRTVTVGLPAPTVTAQLSPLDLVAEAREVVGSYLGSAVPSRDIPHYIDLWRAGRLPLEKLITSHISLSEVNSGFDALREGRVLRQIITFPESE